MENPHFIFTRHPHSISVHVQNLEKLSVDQIREIEYFVSERRGVFDFDTYTFSIQKRLEFDEFVLLVSLRIPNSTCEEKKLKTQQTTARVEFGKYKGMYYSEVPDSYLLWLKSNYRGRDRDVIEEELRYRNI